MQHNARHGRWSEQAIITLLLLFVQEVEVVVVVAAAVVVVVVVVIVLILLLLLLLRQERAPRPFRKASSLKAEMPSALKRNPKQSGNMSETAPKCFKPQQAHFSKLSHYFFLSRLSLLLVFLLYYDFLHCYSY